MSAISAGGRATAPLISTPSLDGLPASEETADDDGDDGDGDAVSDGSVSSLPISP